MEEEKSSFPIILQGVASPQRKMPATKLDIDEYMKFFMASGVGNAADAEGIRQFLMANVDEINDIAESMEKSGLSNEEILDSVFEEKEPE